MPILTGTIVSESGKKAIKGAVVYAENTGVNSTLPAVESDETGRFRLDLAPGTYTIHAQASIAIDDLRRHYSLAAAHGPFDLSADLSIVIEIESRGILVGQALDASSGQGIRGATVRFLEPTGGQFMTASLEEGVFFFSPVRPGSYRIEAEAAGYEPVVQRVFLLDALDNFSALRLPVFLVRQPDSLLPNFGTVRGFVFNEQGNPARGAEVILSAEKFRQSFITAHNYFDYRTGNYEFREVPPGHYELTVVKPGMSPARAEIEVAKGIDSWAPDIQLKSLEPLTSPEIELLTLEPKSLYVGEAVKILVKIKSDLGEKFSASGSIWGPAGWNISFTIDSREKDGSLWRIFENWNNPGLFKLAQLFIVNTDTGRSQSIPTNAFFEVFPRASEVPPLTGDSAIFKVSR